MGIKSLLTRGEVKKEVRPMEFRISTHMVTGKPMVEVWKDGKFVAGIYGHEDGIRIVSKYLDGVEHEVAVPPGVVVKFSKV